MTIPEHNLADGHGVRAYLLREIAARDAQILNLMGKLGVFENMVPSPLCDLASLQKLSVTCDEKGRTAKTLKQREAMGS